MNKFTVKHFDDYHEIESGNGYKAFELGCFPVSFYGYCRYFALYYHGELPSVDAVVKKVLKQVTLGHFYKFFARVPTVLTVG